MLSSILTFPFHVLTSIIRFVFHTLRIPFPRVPFSFLNFYRPLIARSPSRSDPYTVSDRWVRSLEEETGAHCLSRASPIPNAGPSTSQPQTSDLRSRLGPGAPRILPDFTLGSYDEILRRCQSEIRIGCIVLVSNEHDDVPDFKRYVIAPLPYPPLLTAIQPYFDRPYARRTPQQAWIHRLGRRCSGTGCLEWYTPPLFSPSIVH
jgi:FAS-associated factor 2